MRPSRASRRRRGSGSRARSRTRPRAQAGAWNAISSGQHALVVAPTGSGKTLSAFLWSLDRLATTPRPENPKHRTRVLYISPLKALGVDVERNLRSPLVGITQTAKTARDGCPGHHGRRALRRHHLRRPATAAARTAGHLDHHPGIPLPHAHQRGSRDAGRRRHGDRRRDPRGRGHQARRAPRGLARAARRAAAAAGSAHRAVGDGAADGRGGALPGRPHPGDDRRAADREDLRSARRRAGRRHDRARALAPPARRSTPTRARCRAPARSGRTSTRRSSTRCSSTARPSCSRTRGGWPSG